MDEVLKKLYYDPKSGYINLVSLYEKTKELGLYYPFDDVAKWYYEQPVNQVYKKKTPVVSYNKIISHFNMVGEMQADLIDISKFYKQNSHYTFLLNVIDIYSRYAWSYPLKHKTPTEIAPYIEKIFKTIPKHNYKSLCTDKGGEFKGAVIPVLEKYNILSFSNDPNSINAKHTTALVERFNYTLWMRIKKYMYSHSTLRFVDVLDELVYNYNHTKHTTIKQKPYDVMFKNAKPYNYSNDIEKTIEHPFVIGDVVRHEKKRKVFDKKAYNPTYSLGVHKIVGFNNGKYVIENGKEFHPEQLIKATDNIESQFKAISKDNSNDMKKERTLKVDFKMPVEEIEKQIITTKRERKAPVRYNQNIW